MILARSPSTGVTLCAVFLPLRTLNVTGASGAYTKSSRLARSPVLFGVPC